MIIIVFVMCSRHQRQIRDLFVMCSRHQSYLSTFTTYRFRLQRTDFVHILLRDIRYGHFQSTSTSQVSKNINTFHNCNVYFG